TSMVEKPNPDAAPSNLAIIGRYILTPDIFDLIAQTEPGKGGEIQITDALLKQAQRGCVLAYRFKGKRFDCGSAEGYVEATNYCFEHFYKNGKGRPTVRESRKILATGGAGFIGSAVVRHIIRHTADSVVNVDKLTYAGNLESLAEASSSPRYAFEKVDICNRAELDRVFREHQPDAVMHLAAESHVDRSISGPAAFIETNIIGTYNLLEAARQYWLSLSEPRKTLFRFHHISTDEVYGDLEGPDDLFTETTPYAPSSPYSASKASSDHLVRAWRRTYGLPTLVTNCSNNYGPYHFPEKIGR